MTDIPQAAIDAAADVLRLDRPVAWDIIAADVCEAAAPHIAAAERERIRQLALTCQAAHVLGSPASSALEAFAGLLTEGEPDGS